VICKSLVEVVEVVAVVGGEEGGGGRRSVYGNRGL
jgi:hypothetical protein